MSPHVCPETRLLFVAPHPDDETLGGGIILQRAVTAGAAIRVLYLTDGENNPWPQRAWVRSWRVRQPDRLRWGTIRRREARAALRRLGVNAKAEFLAWPDQGLTELLRFGNRTSVCMLEHEIVSWRPSLLLVPSALDTHRDHRAVGETLELMNASLVGTIPCLTTWSYQVHGRRTIFEQSAIALLASKREQATKLAAIHSHRTQMLLSRRRFVRYATRPEFFRRLP